MAASNKNSRGLTLVELLVVMAIIAIIASISIPLLARTTFLESSALQNGSRELYSYMRAAKIYAVDHRVDTAVVYGMVVRDDSLPPHAPKMVANGLLLARGLNDKESRMLQVAPAARRGIFVRIKDDTGQFHRLPDGTCILNIGDGPIVGLQDVTVFDLEADETGSPILVPITGISVPAAAHIFTSSGILHSKTGVQRFELMVAPMPDAEPSTRAATDSSGNVIMIDGVPDYRYIGVEIKPSLGRVKIAS
jgi:prepilin-type N-terminal cleavage/methylation domain-containing protein